MNAPAKHAMRPSMLGAGRIVFGIAMLGFGFVGLLFVDFLNSLQPVPAWIPGYPALAVLTLLSIGAGLIT